MTRLSFAISILLPLEGLAHASSSNVPSYTPKRVAYSALKSSAGSPDDEAAFLDPLVTDGLISVTDIPGFSSLKKDTLTWLHACIMDQGDADAAHHTYDDGTIRRTMAGVTVPGGANQAGVPQPLQVNPEGDRLSSVSSHACDEFSKNLDAFRSAVASTTSLFAERLSNEFEPSLDQTSPLMSTEDGSHTFDNIESLVKEGNHLEHFHSYQKLMNSSPKQSPPPEDASTIDLHTDQGFFIALTPGMIVKHNSLKEDGEDSTLVPDLSTPSELSGGFYIETADGVIAQTQFEEQDELVFMLGDGVNQYVNTKLVPSMSPKKLRATPHSVSLSSFGNDSARVWYGRMVLPPVRGYSEEHQMTYGEIRSNLRKPQQAKTEMTIAHTLGCSSNEAFARQLEGGEFDCDNGGVWCWHRCMTPEPYGFTKQDCDDQDLLMQCINPRGQLYPGGYKHGDYYPACTNTTDEETDPPQIAARDEETCTLAAFEAFTNPSEYDHGMNLTTEETSAHFLWSVTSAGKIKGRLTFNGKFGYLALGFPGPDPATTRKKGMHESKFFMGTPGGNYDESTIGLDLSVGTIVKEYTLAPKTVGSSFRHWDESATDVNPMNQASITEHDCFTSLEFEADCIKDVTFNTTGTDILLWAANAQDTYAGYHGRHRAQFIVEWNTGRSNFTHILEDDDNDDGVECLEKVLDCDNKDSDGTSKLSTWSSCAFTLMSLISAAFVFM